MSNAEKATKYSDRRVEYEDLITATQLQKLSATLDRDDLVPKGGDPIPPGWHPLLFFQGATDA